MTDEALTTLAREVVNQLRDGYMQPNMHAGAWTGSDSYAFNLPDDEAFSLLAAFGRECREAGAIAALEPANHSLGAAWKQKAEQEKARADEAVAAAERQYDQAVEATQRALQAEERADALQQQLDVLRPPAENYNRTLARAEAAESQLATAHARVRELEEERDNSLEGWRQANNRIRSQMKRITQLEEALRGLRTMVVNVLTDSQLDHVNCGQTIRNALGPVDALLSPDDGSQL
jgi:flagellar biosynthesis GTPase FlhF